MKAPAMVIAIIGLLLATLTATHAQPSEWKTLSEEVVKLYGTGQKNCGIAS